jgi:pyridoxamine 5'-phosphate oxidase family protein
VSVCTEDELGYLRGGRRLARLATVGADGTPRVVPVGWSHLARSVDEPISRAA